MIKKIFILIILHCGILAINQSSKTISFEYWINDNIKLFSFEDIINIEIDGDEIEISTNHWLGDMLLKENIEYDNQDFSKKNLISLLLNGFIISEEDKWITGYNLLEKEEIDFRFLFSEKNENFRIYRMDIRQKNRAKVDNTINNVILQNDIIMIWTDLEKNIKKIKFVYKNNTYFLSYTNEE